MLAKLIFCSFHYIFFLLSVLHKAAYLSSSPSWSVRFWVDMKRWIWKIERAILQWGAAVICMYLYSRFCLQFFVFCFFCGRIFSEGLLLKLFISRRSFLLWGNILKTSFDPKGLWADQQTNECKSYRMLQDKMTFFPFQVFSLNISGLLSPHFLPEHWAGLTL